MEICLWLLQYVLVVIDVCANLTVSVLPLERTTWSKNLSGFGVDTMVFICAMNLHIRFSTHSFNLPKNTAELIGKKHSDRIHMD